VIASISGNVTHVGLGDLIVEANGVGYSVFVTTNFALEVRVGSEVSLRTAHIVREDSQSLYGFSNAEELGAFNLLCSVTGVGPKSALAVMGTLGVDGLAQAVAGADDSMFRSVSGIGPKTAKLIVLSLTGKLSLSGSQSNPSSTSETNVVAALIGLGYSERSAKKAVEETSEPKMTEADLLRGALSQLANARRVANDV
jgi:Holliday junction DNA helicase RuvA